MWVHVIWLIRDTLSKIEQRSVKKTVGYKSPILDNVKEVALPGNV